MFMIAFYIYILQNIAYIQFVKVISSQLVFALIKLQQYD